MNWPLLVAAIAITLSWMLQPVMINGWPIAFALFGAAVRPDVLSSGHDRSRAEGSEDESRWHRQAGLVLMSIGVVVALVFLSWSVRLRSAVDAGDADIVEARAGWLIADPSVAMAVARAHIAEPAEGAERERHLGRAEELARTAATRAGDPRHWVFLARVQIDQQDFQAALDTELEAIERHPASPLIYEMVRLTAKIVGDEESEALAVDQLCEFGSPGCADWLDGG